jgi:transposase
MAFSADLRKRVVEAMIVDGMSRYAAAKLFRDSIASAMRWLSISRRWETSRPGLAAAIAGPGGLKFITTISWV